MPMRPLRRILLPLCIASALLLPVPGAFAGRAVSEWVYDGPDGRLAYRQTERGDRIMDFSHAGYKGGGVALPDVPVAVTLSPSGEDDTAAIQGAIDQLGEQPLGEDGFRGAILLKAGQWNVEGPINLNLSGIVIRGEGAGEGGTVINCHGQGGPHTTRVFEVAGEGSWDEVEGTRTRVADAYVPAGARSFRVEDPAPFEAGATVLIVLHRNDQWVRDLGMDRIPARRDGRAIRQWEPGRYVHRFDRVVEAVEGDMLTVDAPLGDAVNERYGGATVFRYTYPGRISNVGIENVRAVAAFQGRPEDQIEEHPGSFINIMRAKNVWVRDVHAYHFRFGNTRTSRWGAKWITIQDSSARDPVSRIAGSRRYPFYIGGQLVLVQRCYGNEARHAFGHNLAAPGPSVFLDCVGEDSLADSGPHHGWASGHLYDNVRDDHSVRVQNRLNFGGQHGWAGANFVLWNIVANHVVLHSPPISHNWAIGVQARKQIPSFANDPWVPRMVHADHFDEEGNFPRLPEWGFGEEDDRHWEHQNRPVRPVSLYLRQLADRLGPQAVRNIADRPYSFQEELEAELGL